MVWFKSQTTVWSTLNERTISKQEGDTPFSHPWQVFISKHLKEVLAQLTMGLTCHDLVCSRFYFPKLTLQYFQFRMLSRILPFSTKRCSCLPFQIGLRFQEIKKVEELLPNFWEYIIQKWYSQYYHLSIYVSIYHHLSISLSTQPWKQAIMFWRSHGPCEEMPKRSHQPQTAGITPRHVREWDFGWLQPSLCYAATDI